MKEKSFWAQSNMKTGISILFFLILPQKSDFLISKDI